MIIRHVLQQIGPRQSRGLVVTADGSPDIILVKTIAASPVKDGCTPDVVMFSWRRELKMMNKRLLREAHLLMNEVI